MLTEKQSGETIEVKGEAPPEAPGAAKLDRDELQRIPGTGNDVVRALSAPIVVQLRASYDQKVVASELGEFFLQCVSTSA